MTFKRSHLLCRVVFSVAALFFAIPLFAAEKFGNSLDWVPEDVSFYSASLRMNEQVDIVAGSNAWKAFRSIPAVAAVWEQAEQQLNNPNSPAAIPLQMLELPENKQLIQMLGEMFSEEILFYGGPKIGDCLELFQIVNAAQQAGAIEEAQQLGEGNDRSAQARAILLAVQENKELLKTPDFLFGFKVKDVAAAQTQLQRLEVLTKMALRQTPYPEIFKREKVGDVEYLTFTFDGSMVPWDQVPWHEVERVEGEFKELRESLEKMTIVVSLGVYQNYLVLSIDESTAHLEKLGKGPALADRSELAPLGKYRDQRVVNIAYLSTAFAEQVQMNSSDIDGIVDQVGSLLDIADIDNEQLKDRLAADIEKLGDDVKDLIAKPGALMAFSFLTSTGYEGYSYNWSENKRLDPSKPLELANHLGGNPVLAVVGRGKYDPVSYDILVKWLQTGYGYFEEFALPEMNADERTKTLEVIEIGKPLVERADRTTRELLIPSLKDGQSAFILDAKASSKQWHADMPASKQPLPMAEMALVVGISDPAAFQQAMDSYKEIANELITKLKEKFPDDIPQEFELPAAETETTEAGKVYKYALPKEAGLDAQIAPSGGIGEHVAVFASTPSLASRVLAETPVASQGLIGQQAGKACATMTTFSWMGLVDAAAPWIEFAVREHAPGSEGAAAEADSPHVADILSQVRTGLNILKCWKTTEVVTTIEDGVTISHSVTTIQDLPE